MGLCLRAATRRDPLRLRFWPLRTDRAPLEGFIAPRLALAFSLPRRWVDSLLYLRAGWPVASRICGICHSRVKHSAPAAYQLLRPGDSRKTP
jgi:hypothetical protein